MIIGELRMQSFAITRTSPFSGKQNTRAISFNIEDYTAWERGELIQNAFPYMSADDREFMKTGITPQEWEETFGES